MNNEELLKTLTFHSDYAPIIIMTEKEMLDQPLLKDVKPRSKEGRLLKRYIKTMESKSIKPLVMIPEGYAQPAKDDGFDTPYLVMLNKENAEAMLNLGEKALSNFVFSNRLLKEGEGTEKVYFPTNLIEDDQKTIEDLEVAIERSEKLEKCLEENELAMKEKEKEKEEEEQKEIDLIDKEEENLSLNEEPSDEINEKDINEEEVSSQENNSEDDFEDEDEDEDTIESRVERYDEEQQEQVPASHFEILQESLRNAIANALSINLLNEEEIDSVFDTYKIKEEANRAGLDYSALLTLVNNTKSSLMLELNQMNDRLEDQYYQSFEEVFDTLNQQLTKEYENIDIRTDITYNNVYSDRIDELDRAKEKNDHDIEDLLAQRRQVLEIEQENNRNVYIENAKEKAAIEFDEAHRDDIDNKIDLERQMRIQHFNDYYAREYQKAYDDANKDYEDSVSELVSKVINQNQSLLDSKQQTLANSRNEYQSKFINSISDGLSETTTQIKRIVNRQIEDTNNFKQKEKDIQYDYEQQLSASKNNEDLLSSKLKAQQQQTSELKKQLKEEQTQRKNENRNWTKREKDFTQQVENYQNSLNEANEKQNQQQNQIESLTSQCETQQNQLQKAKSNEKKGLLYRNLNIFGSVALGCILLGGSVFWITNAITKSNQANTQQNQSQENYVQDLKDQNEKLNSRLEKLESQDKEDSTSQDHVYKTGDKISLDIDGKGKKDYKITKVSGNGLLLESKDKETVFVPYGVVDNDK